MTDSDLTVHPIEPSRLENYVGYRIQVGTEWATLTRVSPTRADWLNTRAPGAGSRPPKVQMYIVEDGVEKCVGTAHADVIVAEPLPDTTIEPPVSVFLASGITDWTASDPQGRARLLNAIGRVDAARMRHGLSPLREITPDATQAPEAYQHAAALIEGYGEPAAHAMGQIDDALSAGHTVFVVDLADGAPDVAYALLGLPGVAMTPDTHALVITPKMDAPTDADATEAQRRANEGTVLVWTTDDDGAYTGDVTALANHLHLSGLTGADYVLNVYALHGRGALVRVGWRVELVGHDEETMWSTNRVRVILPTGTEVNATWKVDGRS